MYGIQKRQHKTEIKKWLMVTVLIIARYLLWVAHRSIFLYTTAQYSATYEYLDFLYGSYVHRVKTVKFISDSNCANI